MKFSTDSVFEMSRLFRFSLGTVSQEQQNKKNIGIPYMTGPTDFGELYPTASRWTTFRNAIAKKGDVLVTVKGAGVGKTNILGLEEAAIGRQLMAIRTHLVKNKFIYFLIRAYKNYLSQVSLGTTVPGISRKDILNLSFGVPSIEEQNHIVTKIDELMALCDRVEENISEQEELANQISASVIHHLDI